MARRASIIVVPLLLAYSTYRVLDLNRRYPLSRPTPYHQTPRVLPTLTQHHGEVDYLVARIPISRPVDDPLGTFLSAFYSTWTLRVEGLLTRIADIAPRHLPSDDEAYCNGLFPILARYPDSVIVQWETPQIIWKFFKDRGKMYLGGGMQELSAVVVEGQGNEQEMEIGYACAQWLGGDDSARRKLAKQLN